MLTAKMDIEDMVREVMTDVRWLESYQTIHKKSIAMELLRSKTLPATVVKQIRSPKTQNEWTLIYTWREDPPIPYIRKYTTLQDEDGIYVYSPIMSDDGLRLIILQPHFFRRYRERLGLGDKLKTSQLIRRYMKLNPNGSFQPSGKRKGEDVWSLCEKEGVVLGVYISERVFLGRTFVTYDMAHEGEQAAIFNEGDEKRSELRMHVMSAREMIRSAHEAERITHEASIEDNTPKSDE